VKDTHAKDAGALDLDPHEVSVAPETLDASSSLSLTVSPKMRAIRRIIAEIVDTNASILLRGESGVGKDVVARAIAAASSRGTPFVKVNCAALPSELLESELFGHERGAFTGAYRRRLGKFEFADKGTLYLDEIGEIPPPLQAKLLHVLQDKEFFRVGGREVIRVDLRIIASTNRDLEAAIAAGTFREDLYYRLNVVEILVPPLRERREEILPLTRHFLEKFAAQAKRPADLAPEVLEALKRHSWPGNVRELENIIRRLVVLGHLPEAQKEILASLTTRARAMEAPVAPGDAPIPSRDPALGLREIARQAAREAERRALKEVLDRVRWNRTEAARLLKVSYKTLLCKISECGLTDRRPSA
jgi:transcriptional regulator with GAF, ATPase, and Fis domain